MARDYQRLGEISHLISGPRPARPRSAQGFALDTDSVDSVFLNRR